MIKLGHEIGRTFDELTMHSSVRIQAGEAQCGKYGFLATEMRDYAADESIDTGGKVGDRLAIQHRGE